MSVELSDHFDDFKIDLQNDWDISFDDLNDIKYDLDIQNSKIILHNYGLKPKNLMASPYFRPQVTLSLIEAMRMTRHVEWLEGTLHRYNPETILLIGRICVADTIAHKIIFAFDTKTEGEPDLWKHLICSDESDIAQSYHRAFEKMIVAGIDENLAKRKSMAIAFNTWFSDSVRVQKCDHDTLNMIDDMMDNYTKFGTKKLEKNAITCLTLIAGKNKTYIDNFLQDDILKNPYYRAVNDPINQSHLLHIMHDLNIFHVNGIAFQDPTLAARFLNCGEV